MIYPNLNIIFYILSEFKQCSSLRHCMNTHIHHFRLNEVTLARLAKLLLTNFLIINLDFY